MAKTQQKAAGAAKAGDPIWYFIVYIFIWLSGIVGLILAGTDKKMKFHSIQAILLGVVITVIGLLPFIGIISILIWLYGLYVGYKAYTGVDENVPVISDFARSHV